MEIWGRPRQSSPHRHPADAKLPSLRKSGVMFVLAANNMSLLSHYQLAAPTSNGQFITTATYNSALNLLYVTSPSDVAASASLSAAWHGLVAMSVQPDCSLKIEWNVTLGIPWSASDLSSNAPYTNPTLASGVVYFADGLHKTLHAVSAHTGVQLWSATLWIPLLPVPKGSLSWANYQGHEESERCLLHEGATSDPDLRKVRY